MQRTKIIMRVENQLLCLFDEHNEKEKKVCICFAKHTFLMFAFTGKVMIKKT
jgi:hypothetical protein